MLSKANRLSRSEIESIVKNGKSLNSPLFSGRFAASLGINTNSVARASFVASKKIFPLSVTRNRVKRKAREAFRGVIKNIKPINVVIFLKKEVILAKVSDISSEFLKVLKK